MIDSGGDRSFRISLAKGVFMKKFVAGIVIGLSILITSGMTLLCGELFKERDELQKHLNGPYQPYIYNNGYHDKNRKA